MGLIFRGGKKLQRGRGIGGVLKSIQALFKPKEKKRKVKLRYFPECKACQKYGRQLHVVEEEDLAYDNKGFVHDDDDHVIMNKKKQNKQNTLKQVLKPRVLKQVVKPRTLKQP